jgi:tetratricopeptide (TPR) repeat protein
MGTGTAPSVEDTSSKDVFPVSDSSEGEVPVEPSPVRETAEPDLERAISLFESGRYPEARRVFETFPECEACPRWIEESAAAEEAAEAARSAREDGNWRGLLISTDALLGLNSQDPRARGWRKVAFAGLLDGSRYDFEAGRYGGVVENFAFLDNPAECPECGTLAEKARNALEMQGEGEAAMEEGRLSAAEVFFQSLLSLNPADEFAQAQLAAIEGLRRTDGRVSELLEGGRGFCGAGNWREGISSLEEALDLKPDCEACRETLESCLEARDEHFYQAGLSKFQGENTAGAITDWARVRPGYKVVNELLERACQLLAGKEVEHPACGP